MVVEALRQEHAPHICPEVEEQLKKWNWRINPGVGTLHLISPGTPDKRGVEITLDKKPSVAVVTNTGIHPELPPTLLEGPEVLAGNVEAWIRLDNGMEDKYLVVWTPRKQFLITPTGTEVKPL